MTNPVLLNNIDHKNLNVITERSAHYGDDVMFAITFPEEFRRVQAHYPIFFHKDASTGKFFAAAMFGLAPQENLFLNQNGWDASYIPLAIVRQPFMIGIQQFQEEGLLKKQRVIHIDMDSPRVNESRGESLFLEHGGNSPYLEHVASLLETIHHGHESARHFVDLLLEFNLLEAFTLDVELDNGSKNHLQGFYTINEGVLADLSGDALARLHDQGWLQAIYMVVASQSHIRSLIDRKNQRL